MAALRFSSVSKISVATLVTAFAALGCSGSKGKQDISVPPQRAGSEAVKTEPTFTDHKPQINFDGTKVVFVSGRASEGELSVPKVYKVDWPAAKAPGEPARLTLGDQPPAAAKEIYAAISAEGLWVAVIGVVEAQTDLWLVNYADGKALQVTDDVKVEAEPQFSPDGHLLSWTSFDSVTGKSNVLILDVSAAPAALPKAYALTKDADAINGAGFWSPAETAPYVFTTQSAADATNDAKAAYSRLDKHSFATAAAAPTSTLTQWMTDLRIERSDNVIAAGDDKAIFIRTDLPGEKRLALQTGDLVEEKKSTLLISTEVSFAAFSESKPSDLKTPFGAKIFSVDINKAGTFAFWVERELYLCTADSARHLGTGLVVGPSGATEVKRYLPLTDPQGRGWEVSDNFCNLKMADGTLGVIDDKVEDAVVAGNSTDTVFRELYVTRFSIARDESCIRMFGDTEVMALEVSGNKKSIYSVSSNSAKLNDLDRNPPCD